MPNGSHAPPSTQRRNGEPQPAPPPAQTEPATAKRDLTSWWKQFSKRSNPKKEEEKAEPPPQGIFGVPLIISIPYANVAISLFNEAGESYIYGYVPIVVAKCGVFLKEKATDVEGIFRLAGSEKRIKELKLAFDTPPRWGKGLDWSGYTVHDAANILRRYFNQLPEPIIPLQYYDAFRQPLRGHQAEAVGTIEGQQPSVGGFDPDAAVRIYQHLIKELPSLNRQLLLYILDLLAVFAAKSDVNKMTTSNLAAIFQPGVLSHPQHDMSPQDYRLSQDVLIFLIDNQDHFLIGMEGTAVDEGTVKHIESGPSTPQAKTPTTPGGRKQSGLGRSASSASSAAAESLRKFGGVRRNVSTSSRHSRQSGAVPSPITPVFSSSGGSGVHRSNTVPSKKSPAIANTRFAKHSDPPTPAGEESKAQETLSAVQPVSQTTTQAEQPVEQSAPASKIETEAVQTQPASTEPTSATAPEQSAAAQPAPAPVPIETAPPPAAISVQPASPQASEPLSAPVAGAPKEQVQEELVPQTAHPLAPQAGHPTPTHDKVEFVEGAAHPSTTPAFHPNVERTFTKMLRGTEKKEEAKETKEIKEPKEQQQRRPNKLQKKNRVPSSTNPSAHSSTHSLSGALGLESPLLPAPGVSSFPLNNSDTMSSRHSGATLKPSMSPSASFRSHSTATEYSEAEHAEDPTAHKEEKERKSFWRSHKRGESKATPTAGQTDFGSIPGADKSMSSFGSSSGWGRRSLQLDSQQGSDASSVPFVSESREHDKKSPFSWFSSKRKEHKEKEIEKQRAKSPPPSQTEFGGSPQRLAPSDLAVRGKSMDVPRTATSEGSSDVTPTGSTPKPLPTADAAATPPANTPANPQAPAPAPASTPSSPQNSSAEPKPSEPQTAEPKSPPPPSNAQPGVPRSMLDV